MSNYMLVGIFLLGCVCGDMIGPGLYEVLHVSKCEGREEDHLIIFDFTQRKYNRTHDAFNTTIIFKTDFDNSFAIQIDIFKCVDGGCKLHSVLKDDDIIHFINEYAKDNVKTFLEMADVNPPDFPLPAGTISATNYMCNYEELPDSGIYGEFVANVMVMDKDKKVVGCLDIKVDFKEIDDN